MPLHVMLFGSDIPASPDVVVPLSAGIDPSEEEEEASAIGVASEVDPSVGESTLPPHAGIPIMASQARFMALPYDG